MALRWQPHHWDKSHLANHRTDRKNPMITETNTSELNINDPNPMMNIRISKRTRFGQWNVRTLMEPSRLAQFEGEMDKLQIAIAGISEMRWSGSGTTTTANGNLVLHSGNVNGGRYGVGIFISKKLKNTLLSWHPVSDRIITARFRCRARHISIVQCYAPTEEAHDDVKDEFYTVLTASLNSINRGDITILMGDFNAKVGSNNTGLKPVMGQHGIGSRNNNGERLLDICQTFQLVIGGTVFPHKDVHKYTWTSPNGHTRNQIDHICISSKWRRSLTDVRNKRGASIDSDHELIIGELKIKLRRPHPTVTRNISNRPRPLNIHRLGETNLSTRLATAIRSQLIPQNHSWEQACNILRNTAEEMIGIKQRRQTNWISERTWNLISRRNRIKPKADQNRQINEEYRTLCKLVKKSARSDKRALLNNLAENAESAAGENNMRSLYQVVAQLAGGYRRQTQPIRDADGNLLTDDDAQLQRWRQHFMEISSNETPSSNHEYFRNVAPNINLRIPPTPPTSREIGNAIRKLKHNKSAGVDGIPAELLQVDTQLMAEVLHPYFTHIWENECVPASWKNGIIVKIPKKGDLSDCNNWRGITLLNTSYKILATLLNERLLEKIEPTLRDEQAGFRPHRSCVDQANTLRVITEQAVEWRSPLYLLFIDFKKAFDTVDRTAIWRTLARKGVPTNIIAIIKNMYDDADLAVLHNGKISAPFQTITGVKQGCPLSPLLFNLIADEIMSEVCKTRRGITWSFTKHLEDLDYADDICLMSHKLSDIQAKVNDLENLASKVGLTINASKTKAMRFNHTSQCHVTISGNTVEFVDSFSYLGTIISTNGGVDEDVESRLNKARSAFGRLYRIWRNQQISKRTKLRIFNACVKSILLYGSETWLTSQRMTQKLQSFVNKCLRIICGIFWPNRISNTDLWLCTNEVPIDQQIRRRKWKWIGHALRKNQNSIVRMALEWNPQGSRRVGRPKSTWRRTSLQELSQNNITWDTAKQTAPNRVRWKALVEALSSQEE